MKKTKKKKTKPTASHEVEYTYQKAFYPVYEGLYLFLPHKAVLLLSFLMRQEKRFSNADGWFYCTAKTLKAHLEMSEDQQTDWLKVLVVKGLIATQRGGNPPKRYILINHKEVERQYIKAETADR